MESTKYVLFDAFVPIYVPLDGDELQDLYQCKTTGDIKSLNTQNI